MTQKAVRLLQAEQATCEVPRPADFNSQLLNGDALPVRIKR